MPEYKVTHSRFDCPTETLTSFTAENDERAREKFMELTREKSWSWDDLILYKIVKPAVAEVTQTLSQAIRQGRTGQEITHLP